MEGDIEPKYPQKAIIFIHGAGENSNLWKFQIESISKYFKTIAVDLPGHANSDGFNKISMDLFLRTIDMLIKYINSEKIVLCGHSMGGAISMKYYLEYDKIDALILIGTGAKLKVSPMIFETLTTNFESALQYLDSIAIYIRSKEIKDFLHKEAIKTRQEIYINDFHICNNFNIMDQLDQLTIPTLIICGEKDVLTPVKYSKYLNEKIKNNICHIIPKSGHDVHIEKPEVVNKLIKEFMESI
ncbi:MAG: alpha/beta fold hydrolase [Candidatus Helarchaeota archaeon]